MSMVEDYDLFFKNDISASIMFIIVTNLFCKLTKATNLSAKYSSSKKTTTDYKLTVDGHLIKTLNSIRWL